MAKERIYILGGCTDTCDDLSTVYISNELDDPTKEPTNIPTQIPLNQPSNFPTNEPSSSPLNIPSFDPSFVSTVLATRAPIISNLKESTAFDGSVPMSADSDSTQTNSGKNSNKSDISTDRLLLYIAVGLLTILVILVCAVLIKLYLTKRELKTPQNSIAREESGAGGNLDSPESNGLMEKSREELVLMEQVNSCHDIGQDLEVAKCKNKGVKVNQLKNRDENGNTSDSNTTSNQSLYEANHVTEGVAIGPTSGTYVGAK